MRARKRFRSRVRNRQRKASTSCGFRTADKSAEHPDDAQQLLPRLEVLSGGDDALESAEHRASTACDLAHPYVTGPTLSGPTTEARHPLTIAHPRAKALACPCAA